MTANTSCAATVDYMNALYCKFEGRVRERGSLPFTSSSNNRTDEIKEQRKTFNSKMNVKVTQRYKLFQNTAA